MKGCFEENLIRDSLTEVTSPPPSACPDSWVACSDGECIEETKVCDFTPNCLHGEDEASCRKTDH